MPSKKQRAKKKKQEKQSATLMKNVNKQSQLLYEEVQRRQQITYSSFLENIHYIEKNNINEKLTEECNKNITLLKEIWKNSQNSPDEYTKMTEQHQIITKELIIVDNVLKDMWGKYLKTVADFRISIINLSDFLEPYINKYD